MCQKRTFVKLTHYRNFCPQAGKIGRQVKTAGGVCLNGENLGKWPPKRGPVTKIMPSDGRKGDTVPLPVERWYDSTEFGCHLGNVDSIGFRDGRGLAWNCS